MPRSLPIRPRQHGAIQILLLVALLMATFLMCLIIDLSRVSARKIELQVAVDAAALAAANYLKTSPGAFVAAASAAGQGTNGYDYRAGSSHPVRLPSITVKFNTIHTGSDWRPAGSAAAGAKYVRVDSVLSPDEAYGKVDLLLMYLPHALGYGPEASSQFVVSAAAVAGPLNNGIGLRQ